MPLSATGLGGGAASLFRASAAGGLYNFQDATFTNNGKTGYQRSLLKQEVECLEQVIITLKTIQISLPSLMEYNTGLYQ